MHIITYSFSSKSQPTFGCVGVCVFGDILLLCCSCVISQGIIKTIGEITGVTSAAVIHSISPSLQEGLQPRQPQLTRPHLFSVCQYRRTDGLGQSSSSTL